MIDDNACTNTRYPGDRIAYKHPSGFLVIVPVDDVDASYVPLSCPLCSCLMRTQNDDASFVDWGCCDKCAMAFAHPRRAEWKAGWRPSLDVVVENVSSRQRLAVIIS